MKAIFYSLVSALFTSALATSNVSYKYLGKIDTPNPAFVKVE